MVQWKVRNIPWKFQVQKKSGTHFFLIRGEVRFLKILNDPNFFLLQITQNGPIRENKWFLEIFIFFLHIGHQASRLGHFSTIFENEVLVDVMSIF